MLFNGRPVRLHSVPANRGGTNELFSDEQSAEEWLLK